MRRWWTRAAVALTAASAVVVLGAIPAAQADDGTFKLLSTVMTGAQEVPGPGDPDGRGAFAAVVKGDQLCYAMVADRIETATAAHIHAAPAGVAGGIVVGLKVPNKFSAACITAVPDDQNSTATLTQSELAAIVATPADFYVNVHNAPFPAGAIRGQLH